MPSRAVSAGPRSLPSRLREMRQVEPAAVVDDARHADHGAVDQLPPRPGGVDQCACEDRDCIQRRVGAGAGELDILPHADVAGEITDGAAGEPCAEVEPEHERGIRHRLEEHRPEARAVGIVFRLADEPRAEERLQCKRHRGLRDPGAPRDLRAGDRCTGADRVEYRPLVHVLQQRRNRRAARFAGSCHLGWNPNEKARISAGRLTATPEDPRLAFVKFPNLSGCAESARDPYDSQGGGST